MMALEIHELSSGYGDSLVLRDIDLHVAPNGILAILGKNGMGKSTLLKTIMGFLAVRNGTIRLFDEDITSKEPHAIARKGVAYIQQEKALFQDLTVGENLRIGLSDNNAFKAGLEHVSRHFQFLPERLAQPAGTLSGGEQKMLLVARALMSRPRLMIVDEITEGLQPSVINRLRAVFREECEKSHTTIVLVEQNVPFALSIADAFAVLSTGEIVDHGDATVEGAHARIDKELSI